MKYEITTKDNGEYLPLLGLEAILAPRSTKTPQKRRPRKLGSPPGKIEKAKLAPKSTQNPTKIRSKTRSNNYLIFNLIFHRFLIEHGSNLASKILQKSIKKAFKIVDFLIDFLSNWDAILMVS